MCFDRSQDWNAFFNQPVEDYHKWLTDGIYEEAEMAIVDLIKLSQAQTVVADRPYPLFERNGLYFTKAIEAKDAG